MPKKEKKDTDNTEEQKLRSTEEDKVTEKMESADIEKVEETGESENKDLSSQLGKGEVIQLDIEESSNSIFSMKKIAIVLAVLLLLAGIGGGGYYFFLRSDKTKPAGPIEDIPSKKDGEGISNPSKEEKPKESTKESDTKKANEDKAENIVLSDYSVEVLNGSGVAGEAGAVKDLLEKEGFSEISADNADSYDYTDTEVRIKKDIPKKVFDLIKEKLSNYSVVQKEDLSEDNKYDIQIIIGQKQD